MTQLPLYVYVVLALLRFAPIERLPAFPGHEETQREALARYGAIAEAIVAVCETKARPHSCAALLVAIGKGESHFARDADIGPCHRGKGYRARCGGGKAASVWQVESDFAPAEIFADRQLAASLVYLGAHTCSRNPAPDALAGLSGTCKPTGKHLEATRAHYRMWLRVAGWRP